MLVLLLSGAVALAGFKPNVRVGPAARPYDAFFGAHITVGPSDGRGTQPLYVAFESDSISRSSQMRADIAFQKSTDAGATWLPENALVARGDTYAWWPDITTDRVGNIYVAFIATPTLDGKGHVYCSRSTDAGATWSRPAQVDDDSVATAIGYASIAADSAGDLLAAWHQKASDNLMHIFSSVSTDLGATWQAKVRLDDTAFHSCYHADVAVQPGSNTYLVAAEVRSESYLYRSTDRGLTFQPGERVDTFGYAAWGPHVVADREHIICDYSGQDSLISNGEITEARTFYSGPDTWGSPVEVAHLDSGFRSYPAGGCLALSADGKVHTALMICGPASGYDVFYSASTDHGASWSERMRINDTTTYSADPDIGADSAGRVYAVWQDHRNGRKEIWFSTYDPAGVEETRLPGSNPIRLTAEPNAFSRTTTIRLSHLSPVDGHRLLSVYDASGRLVRSLALPSSPTNRPCSLAWDGRDASGTRCPAGLYVLRCGTAAAKVILLPAQ